LVCGKCILISPVCRPQQNLRLLEVCWFEIYCPLILYYSTNLKWSIFKDSDSYPTSNKTLKIFWKLLDQGSILFIFLMGLIVHVPWLLNN
jgi:hypothetical protein